MVTYTRWAPNYAHGYLPCLHAPRLDICLGYVLLSGILCSALWWFTIFFTSMEKLLPLDIATLLVHYWTNLPNLRCDELEFIEEFLLPTLDVIVIEQPPKLTMGFRTGTQHARLDN